MDIFEQLRQAVIRAQEENDLPDFLAAQIFRIADHPQKHRLRRQEVTLLIGQLDLYDTYGQTGYLGMGVSNLILQGTLKRLEERLLAGK
jgi:hypothetical protein